MAQKKSFFRRLAWLIFGILFFFVVASAALVTMLRRVDPPYSAFMAEMQAAARAKHDRAYVFRHRWVDLTQISPDLPLAVMASEDQKFPEHRGFDVEAIEKAYETNQNGHRVRGASTISQQVAKNLFLWSGRSYFRKGLEAYFTVLIEACLPKRRIMEIYLNIVEFGYGTYGAEAAAQQFFHTSAAKLTRNEAALLAAVLPNPERLLVAAPSAYVELRRDWILGQMQMLGGAGVLGEIDAQPGRRR